MTAPTIPSREARGPAVRLARRVEATAAVLAMVSGLALVTHVVSVHAVEGESMAATLCPGASVLVWHPGASRAGVGDLVMAGAPDGTTVLKRIAGVGGDTIAFDDGRLVRNDETVLEPWLDLESVDGVFVGATQVPPSSVFLLGDGRERSVDSRHFGPVDRTALRGRVLTGLGGSCGDETAD